MTSVDKLNMFSPSTRGNLAFSFVVVFYILHQLTLQPNWVVGGGMWAEMATNYYLNAESPSLLTKLFATDAGYIPIVPRIIALIGNQINLPVTLIPYFYTFTALILSGMMVGCFCLSIFRKLLLSDSLRVVIAISVLMVADFETRTFVNFSYFSAFFIAIVTSLAFKDKFEEVPWWAWLIPICVISKPAVASAIPAMVIASIFSKNRFRQVTAISLLLFLMQFIQMVISSRIGVMHQVNETSLVSKLVSSVLYFFGFLGGYAIGPAVNPNKYLSIQIGICIFIISIFVILKIKNRATSLIGVGASLLLFNVILNCFALTDSWNLNLNTLKDIPVYRHTIVGYFGVVLIIAALISCLFVTEESQIKFNLKNHYGTFLFCIWFTVSGWFLSGLRLSKEPISPTIGNSQWQKMAHAIEIGTNPICVPVDPWHKRESWLYQRNCQLLKIPPFWKDGSLLIKDPLYFDLSPPVRLFEKKLLSAAVLAKPLSSKNEFIEVRMLMTLRDGNKVNYQGSNLIRPTGGLIQLNGPVSVKINEIVSIRLYFNLPVEIALASDDPPGLPGIAWMGN